MTPNSPEEVYLRARADFAADTGAADAVSRLEAAARELGGPVLSAEAMGAARARASSPEALVETGYLLAVALRDLGEVETAFGLMNEVCAARDDPGLDQFRVVLGLYRDGADEAFLSELRGWFYARARARRAYTPLRPRRDAHDGPLRVAFLGWDPILPFYAALLVPLLRTLDPARVRPIAIVPDAPEQALAPLRALGIDARGLAVGGPWAGERHALAARELAALELDVLVDLGDCLGPTAAIPLHRVAPIQVTWQNMLGPCPDPVFDALIGNAALYPGGPVYAGKARLMPSDLFVYDPYLFGEGPPPPAPAPCLREGRVTFGSLSALYKMGESSLALWAKVVRAVPGSRLRLGNAGFADARVRARVSAILARHGVDPTRVDFGVQSGWPGYLAGYQGIDIALATVPVAGGTTMFEAAYQGVPILSRVTPTPLGRIGRWIEAATGRPGTAHDDDDSLIETAKAWASDPGELARWRAGARARLDAKRALDAPRQARAFEAILAELTGAR